MITNNKLKIQWNVAMQKKHEQFFIRLVLTSIWKNTARSPHSPLPQSSYYSKAQSHRTDFAAAFLER